MVLREPGWPSGDDFHIHNNPSNIHIQHPLHHYSPCHPHFTHSLSTIIHSPSSGPPLPHAKGFPPGRLVSSYSRERWMGRKGRRGQSAAQHGWAATGIYRLSTLLPTSHFPVRHAPAWYTFPLTVQIPRSF